MPEEILNEMAQLTKENSIEGSKAGPFADLTSWSTGSGTLKGGPVRYRLHALPKLEEGGSHGGWTGLTWGHLRILCVCVFFFFPPPLSPCFKSTSTCSNCNKIPELSHDIPVLIFLLEVGFKEESFRTLMKNISKD